VVATLTMPTLVPMTRDVSERLLRAVARHKTAIAEEEAARRELHAAILGDAEDDVRQADIVRATGYTREHIRRILLAARSDRDQAAEQ